MTVTQPFASWVEKHSAHTPSALTSTGVAAPILPGGRGAYVTGSEARRGQGSRGGIEPREGDGGLVGSGTALVHHQIVRMSMRDDGSNQYARMPGHLINIT